MSGLDSLTAEEAAAFEPAPSTPEPAPAATPEPAAVEAPASEAAPAETPATPEAQRQRMVPHQALHEERETRKQAEKRAALAEERAALAADRMARLMAVVQPPQPETPAAPALPAYEENPGAHLLGKTVAQEQELATLRTWKQNIEQQQTQQARAEHIGMAAQAMQEQFRAVTPDYDQASAFLRQMNDRELQLHGVADPVKRATIMRNMALQVAEMALSEGANPAERVYELAKLRGYRPPQAAAPAGVPAATPPAPAADAVLRQVQEGQQRGSSIGTAASAPTPKPMSVDALLQMSDNEYAAFLAKAKAGGKMGDILGH